MTGSDWGHLPVASPLSYDPDASSLETHSYADAGSYEYTYAGTDIMSSGIPPVQCGSHVRVMCYRILSSGVKPYIMFGLCQGAAGLGLMDVEMPDLGAFRRGMADIGKRFGTSEMVYRGYLCYGTDTVLCVEDVVPEQNVYASRSPDCQWVLSTEIVNHSRLLEHVVDPRVVEFLEANPSLLFLYDELGNLHESPEVGYYGTSRRRAASLAVLGAPCEEPSSDVGPYYRFFDYEGGVSRAREHSGDDGTVLMRFALFLGRTAMCRISEDWSGYDSLRTPDGIICVKEYNQQIPLSSHTLPRLAEV